MINRINTIFKRVLPIEVNYLIRRKKQLFHQKTPSFNERANNSKNRVFFLDAPAYANIGDQAIAYAMEQFMKRILPDYEQFEIQEDVMPHYIKWLKGNLRQQDIICLTGGGNMGIMYQSYEATRRFIMKCFKDNLIIVFPQTLDYGSSIYGRKEFLRSAIVYNRCNNLVLAARDLESFEKMKEVYSSAKVVFCPDIALSLDYTKCQCERHYDLGLCIRDDEESAIDKHLKNRLMNELSSALVLSTIDESGERIVGNLRRTILFDVLNEFASCKMVITDRLHGTIFSFITNTPVFSFPNSNGKVERICNLLKEYGSVMLINDISDISFTQNVNNRMLNSEFDDFKLAILSHTSRIGR